MQNKEETRGRKQKRDIEGFIKKLSREEPEDIARVHIEQNEKKKQSKRVDYKSLSKSKEAFVANVHRTTLYKKAKLRTYKLDAFQNEIRNSFEECRSVYGRRRLAIYLMKLGISVNERTLGRHMNRHDLSTITRVARRRRENKDTSVEFPDLVKRNYNPSNDNILATDVSYIPADVPQNFVYLSIAISHKTKLIESFKLSDTNDNQLVVDTIADLNNRRDFILHSDHGSQYSSRDVQAELDKVKAITSMGRVGNSLDNREAEYFFSCLKGEFLNHKNTRRMNLQEITVLVSDYIK